MASATEITAHPAGSPLPQPLRSRLFMLVASGLFPLAIAALLGTAYLIQQRRHDAQRSALELSRALATAVDSELKSIVGVLESPGCFQCTERSTSWLHSRGWPSGLRSDRAGATSCWPMRRAISS